MTNALVSRLLFVPVPVYLRRVERDAEHPAGRVPPGGPQLLGPAGVRPRREERVPLLHRRQGQGPLDGRTQRREVGNKDSVGSRCQRNAISCLQVPA